MFIDESFFLVGGKVLRNWMNSSKTCVYVWIGVGRPNTSQAMRPPTNISDFGQIFIEERDRATWGSGGGGGLRKEELEICKRKQGKVPERGRLWLGNIEGDSAINLLNQTSGNIFFA